MNVFFFIFIIIIIIKSDMIKCIEIMICFIIVIFKIYNSFKSIIFDNNIFC